MQKIIKFIAGHRFFDIALIFALNLFCCREWFRPGIISYGDWSYYPREFLSDSLIFPFCWTSRFFTGPTFMLYNWPLQGIISLISRLGFDFGVSERVVYFFPYVILSVLGIYYFTYVLFKQRIICFFSTLFYVFNMPNLMVVAGGLLDRTTAYALVPLALAFFIKGEKENQFINHLLSGVILAVMTFYELRVSYITAAVILLFFSQKLWKIVINKKYSLKNFITPFFYLGVVFFIPLILNFYWLYASLVTKSSYMPAGYNLSNMVSALSYYKFKYCLAFYLPWWIRGPQPNIFYYVPPLLVFLGIFLRPKDSRVRLLTFLAVVSLVLTMGANPPLGKLYIWLFKHLPGFDAFRDPGKFFMLMCLAYAPLLGVSVDSITSRLKRAYFKIAQVNIKSRYLISAFLFTVFFIILYLIWPIMTGRVGGAFVNVHLMPKEYKRIEEFIKNQAGSFRTFWRPTIGRFVFYSDKFPAFCTHKTSPATRFFFGENWDANVFNRSKYIAKVLGLLNVKYCFVPQEEELQKVLNKDKDFYLSTYQDKIGLERRELADNVIAFENQYFAPRFFTTVYSSLVVGSKKSLLDLADFKDIDISGFTVFFSDEMTFQNRALLKKVDSVILYDSDINDLVLNAAWDEYRFDLTKYATPPDETRLNRWQGIYVFPADIYGYLDGVMTQNSRGPIYDLNGFNCELVSPLEVSIDEPGTFEVWVRAMRGPTMGALNIWVSDSRDSVDSRIKILQDKLLKSGNFYFQWIKADPVYLNKGRHFLGIINQNGRGMLDQLILIPQKNIETLRREVSDSLSSKEIIIFKNCYSLPLVLSVPQEGSYRLVAQLLPDNFSGKVDFLVNGSLINSLTLDKSKEPFFTEVGQISLNKGEQEISIMKAGEGALKLQKLILYKTKETVNSFEEIFPKGSRMAVDGKMINPTRYEVKLRTEKPVHLVFSDAFDPGWTLNLKKPVPSLSAYGMINSFYIEDPVDMDAIIEFAPQQYLNRGVRISLGGLILICGGFLFAGVDVSRRKSKLRGEICQK